ncbi:DoxX family protein [Litorivita sp. NS0012-18]|uniref:DoxX family protein n=1 Tax=Litorivita sp. NS0012-18 TaxID=3127655 RepID=UPI003105BA40
MERSLIHPILEHPATAVFARILATFMYWYAGIGFLLNFSGAIQTMEAQGFTQSPALIAALTLTVQLVGSAIVISGRHVWFGVGILSVFTLATIPLVHDFWNMTGAAAIQAQLETEEHMTVIGGLLAVAILSHVLRMRARLAPAQ